MKKIWFLILLMGFGQNALGMEQETGQGEADSQSQIKISLMEFYNNYEQNKNLSSDNIGLLNEKHDSDFERYVFGQVCQKQNDSNSCRHQQAYAKDRQIGNFYLTIKRDWVNAKRGVFRSPYTRVDLCGLPYQYQYHTITTPWYYGNTFTPGGKSQIDFKTKDSALVTGLKTVGFMGLCYGAYYLVKQKFFNNN